MNRRRKILIAILVITEALFLCSMAWATVPGTTVKTAHLDCDGDDKTFAFTMPYSSSGEIKVDVCADDTDEPDRQTETSDYSVSPSSSTEGGTVTFVTAPEDGYYVVISRTTSQTQQADISASHYVKLGILENIFDKTIRIIQELSDGVSRSIRTPVSEISPDMELPGALDRADKFIHFDTDGVMELVRAVTTLFDDFNDEYFEINDRQVDPNFTGWEAWLDTLNYLDLDTYPNADTNGLDDVVDSDFDSAGLMRTDGSGGYSVDPNVYITADPNSHDDVTVVDSNTVDLTLDGQEVTADVTYQSTTTVTLSEDASGIKGDVNESGLEGILDLQDLQGAITDAQCPNDITITETDPVFGAADSNDITHAERDNWDTAYGWGDHSGTYLDLATYDVLENGYVDGNDTAYNATTWDNNLDAPSMGAVRDAIEALDIVGGLVIQEVYTLYSDVATGTGQIPLDDTVPQIDEGDEYLTQAITPVSETDILKIDVLFCGAGQLGRNLSLALFEDSDPNSIAAVSTGTSGANMRTLSLTYYQLAGGTEEITFKVRAGLDGSGTMTFNGAAGSRVFGGVCVSSITVTEIKP